MSLSFNHHYELGKKRSLMILKNSVGFPFLKNTPWNSYKIWKFNQRYIGLSIYSPWCFLWSFLKAQVWFTFQGQSQISHRIQQLFLFVNANTDKTGKTCIGDLNLDPGVLFSSLPPLPNSFVSFSSVITFMLLTVKLVFPSISALLFQALMSALTTVNQL